MTPRALWLALAALVAACGPRDEPTTTPSPSATSTAGATPAAPASPGVAQVSAPTVALDGEGLRFISRDTGSARLLAFGTARETVDYAVARSVDAAPQKSRLEECPSGPTDFSRYGALQLAFQAEKFVGWAADGKGAHTTIDGFGVGSTQVAIARSRVFTMVPDSTLGQEFVLGPAGQTPAIFGIFDRAGPTGSVTNLWAGIACNFR